MKVFISYRRADSQTTAGRLAQLLDSLPVVQQVFLDVDNITLGDNFAHKIDQTLAQATHVFVLIGPAWAGPAGDWGASRLFDAADMVRSEVALALASTARVVPVLIDDTRMPRAAELPEPLKPLAQRNAFSLRTAHFEGDVDDLLDGLLGQRQGRGSRWRQAPLTLAGGLWRGLAGAVGGAATLLGLALLNHFVVSDGAALASTLQAALAVSEADAIGLIWLLAAVLVGGGAALPFALRRWQRRP